MIQPFPRDYDGPGSVQHRNIGPRDLYALYNGPKTPGAVSARSARLNSGTPGPVQRDRWPSLPDDAPDTNCAPLTEKEIQFIVFSPGKPQIDLVTSANFKSRISN